MPAFPLMLGYMMLIREGEGEGARDEKVLETLETSQFWRSSSSSNLVGPPSVLSGSIRTQDESAWS